MWRVVPTGSDLHVVPVADLREHDYGARCWCQPTEDREVDVWVHHAMDEREKYEAGERTAS